MCRHFRLYLRTNNELFTQDFSAVVVDEDGSERRHPVDRHSFFTGHVIGKRWWNLVRGFGLGPLHSSCLGFCFPGEEHSRVQAHLDEHEFSARILTEEAEYNVEVR